MKKNLFLHFLSFISLTTINVVSCQQNKIIHLKEKIELLYEFEDQLKNFNWKTPSYNEENDNLEKMINNLEAIKLKINIAEKLEYSEKTIFYNEFNKLKKQVETLKTITIPNLKKMNLVNINAIFTWINDKITKYIEIIKVKIADYNSNKIFIKKVDKSEIINNFFTNFPKENILSSNDQSQSQIENEDCSNINCDITNFTNKLLHHFYIIEQMKTDDETDDDIATKKIEILHKLWIKLWNSDLETIYQNFKNPTEDFYL